MNTNVKYNNDGTVIISKEAYEEMIKSIIDTNKALAENSKELSKIINQLNEIDTDVKYINKRLNCSDVQTA